jgi:hypothetical protein
MAEFVLAIALESNGPPMALMYVKHLAFTHDGAPSNITQDLSLHLNKIENEKWSTVDTAFENLRQQAGDGEYLFEIPKVKENKSVFCQMISWVWC